MFCCLHWIHFMDETEDSIDIKVNYKRKVNYEHLAECLFIKIECSQSIFFIQINFNKINLNK